MFLASLAGLCGKAAWESHTTSTERQVDDFIAGQSVHTYRLIKASDKAHIRVTTRRRNMVKQRICGIVIALCGVVPMMIDKDATAFIFFAIFFLPMIFSKRCVMTLYS